MKHEYLTLDSEIMIEDLWQIRNCGNKGDKLFWEITEKRMLNLQVLCENINKKFHGSRTILENQDNIQKQEISAGPYLQLEKLAFNWSPSHPKKYLVCQKRQKRI
uniref:Uncharacterized protein n=1 Tax=Micrurus corallinus TaxID=54390 RepID=A0A2D4EQB2_MICCO